MKARSVYMLQRCFIHYSSPFTFYFILGLQCTVFCQNPESVLGVPGSSGQSYDLTYPEWLKPIRTIEDAQTDIKHPLEAEIKITVEGMELVLQLQRNEMLLAPNYQEVWYGSSGARQFSSTSSKNHCYYHGEVKNVQDSSVVVSTCAGLRGIIALNHSATYLIEPLANQSNSQGHAVFHAESLKISRSTCNQHHREQNYTNKLEELISGIAQAYRASRVRRDLSYSMKYVELMMVADHTEFEKHGSSIERTKTKLLEAANYVDKYYKALNIRIALISLEIWNDQDKIQVSDNPYSTLGNFLTWRSKQLRQLPNDNAQLITGRKFQGTTLGLAPLKTMCSEYQSGGVNSDHSETALGVAATMAHEMGHNFGMNHDNEGCCQARPEDGGCIMAAATGHPFPRVFNPCNQADLKKYLNSGGGKCLFNLPNTRAIYGGPHCGNGYLEEGEECDCGEVSECSSPCCNANNCTLKAGAECAQGVCCDNCKLKSPGVVCRASSSSCDVPEYCNGKWESCPADFYLIDGSPCENGKAYCYTGMCLTLEQQCLSLWGKGARPAPDVCFTEVNKAGDTYGNCGKDLMGKYRSCSERNARCGKIQCLSTSSKPTEANAVAIETTIHDGQHKILCKGTHVYRQSQNDMLDPGLVMTGTKCGENAICFGGECRNASFLEADECSAKCHGHGLCNNNHNCHCDGGWAPPYCNKAGKGGSVDSGPVIKQRGEILLVILLLVFILVLIIMFLFWFLKWKRRSLKDTSSQITISESTLPNTSDRGGSHTNPVFQPKKPDMQVNCPAGQPKFNSPTLKPAFPLQQRTPPFPENNDTNTFPSLTSKPQRPPPPRRPPPSRPHVQPVQKTEVETQRKVNIAPALPQK